MNENLIEVVRKWLLKADHDLKNIENNLSAEEIPYDTLCFHAQQAIEKCLKGALVFFGQDISKTHDLVWLLQSLTPFIRELAQYEDELEKITEFAVEARYPDVFYEPSLDETKQAYHLAIKIKEIVSKKLKI